MQSEYILVNGVAVDMPSDGDMALLVMLRETLALKGSRFGCGQGLCGACLVLVDGRPAFSCSTPVWSVAGRSVTTVEALVSTPLGGRIVSALLSHQAGQCGYCLSGIFVRLYDVLSGDGPFTRAGLAERLERNLCRCGAHDRILRAALSVAVEGAVG
jgi:nicotinate dehydrogenase subunit A